MPFGWLDKVIEYKYHNENTIRRGTFTTLTDTGFVVDNRWFVPYTSVMFVRLAEEL